MRKRGLRASHIRTGNTVGRVVIDDQINRLSCNLRLLLIEVAQEFEELLLVEQWVTQSPVGIYSPAR